jgi:DNA sulfur modification protein DndC
MLLDELLKAQQSVRESHPDLRLVTEQELAAIQVVWDRDMIFSTSVQGQRTAAGSSGASRQDADSVTNAASLERICAERGHPEHYGLLCHLIQSSRGRLLLSKGSQARADIERVLREFVDPRMTDVYKLDRGQ